MKKITLFTLAAISGLLCLSAGENLLPNGNFDEGESNAANWEKTDGLTSFWVSEDGRGRVLKMDTRVSNDQVLEWKNKRKIDSKLKPPEPIFPKEPLKTVANETVEGVALDSIMITVKPGQNYKLSVDYKGNLSPIIWIKGFRKHPVKDYYTNSYQTRLVPEGGKENEWQTYSIGFNPTERSPGTIKMKVRIHPYWPPAVYYFDNVRVEEITPAEMQELVKKREN
ncbi:MAG: hypothetical protein WCI51_03565 [Lentisphaerota bacterium]